LRRPSSSTPTAFQAGRSAGDRGIAMNRGERIAYLAGDHLGSTSVAMNEDQTLRAKRTYRPYGAVYPAHQEGVLPTDYEFTGQRHEEPGDLYQMGARWYDPYLNRWAQPDTLIPDWYNPQSLNRYSYVLNNPLRYTDPTGHCDPDYCRWDPDTDGDRNWTMHNKDYDDPGDSTGNDGPALLVYVPLPGQTDPSQITKSDPLIFRPPTDDPFWYLRYGFPEGTIFAYPVIVGSAGGPYSPLPGSGPAAGRTVFRVCGGGSKLEGQSWGPMDPDLFANPARSLGLPKDNSGIILLRGTLLDPRGITVKVADSVVPNPGGATEWVVPKPMEQIRLDQVIIRSPGGATSITPKYSATFTSRAMWELLTRFLPY
jgi:RHS repeat-associated protein